MKIDPYAVLASLGLRSAGQVQPLSGGMDTAMWRFRSESGGWQVLRLYRAGQGARANRERAALAAASAAGLPVAKVEAFGEYDDHSIAVLSWLPGQPLLDALKRRPWRLWRLGREMGRLQAQIHRVSPPPALREDAPDYWLKRAGSDEAELIDRLRALRPSLDALVHLDFHPLNVLVEESAISGIIDWADAAAGDPRADLARTWVILAVAPPPPGPLRPVLLPARRLLFGAWRSGYMHETGPLPQLAPFLAWAGAQLLHDLERRRGEPQMWVTEDELEGIRRKVADWKARAGV